MCWQGGFERAARDVYRRSSANLSPGLSQGLLDEAFERVSGAHALLFYVASSSWWPRRTNGGPEFISSSLSCATVNYLRPFRRVPQSNREETEPHGLDCYCSFLLHHWFLLFSPCSRLKEACAGWAYSNRFKMPPSGLTSNSPLLHFCA